MVVQDRPGQEGPGSDVFLVLFISSFLAIHRDQVNLTHDDMESHVSVPALSSHSSKAFPVGLCLCTRTSGSALERRAVQKANNGELENEPH